MISNLKFVIKNNDLLKSSFRVGLVSLFSNSISFLIPIYIAYEYSVSKQTDVFFLSFNIIVFLGTIFSGAVRSVSIPYIKERLVSRLELQSFISSVMRYISRFLACFLGLVAIVCYWLFASTNDDLYLYLLLSLPIAFLTVVNAFCYGILNSFDQFYLAELSPVFRAIVIIVTVFFFSNTFGIISVIIGYNLGELAKFFHLFLVIKIKNKLNIFSRTFISTDISSFLRQGAYQVFSVSLAASSPLIDRAVASFLIVGSISLIDYGDRIFVVFNVLLNSFLIILTSKWAKEVLEKKFSLLRFKQILLVLFGITFSLAVIIYFSKSLIIDVLYSKLTESEKETVAIILFLNTFGFIFSSVNQAIHRASMAIKSTDIMVITAVIKVVLNIVLNVILAAYWGVIGIIVSTVIVHLVGLIVNYFLFIRRFNKVNLIQ